jgi:hypothetical protein
MSARQMSIPLGNARLLGWQFVLRRQLADCAGVNGNWFFLGMLFPGSVTCSAEVAQHRWLGGFPSDAATNSCTRPIQLLSTRQSWPSSKQPQTLSYGPKSFTFHAAVTTV